MSTWLRRAQNGTLSAETVNQFYDPALLPKTAAQREGFPGFVRWSPQLNHPTEWRSYNPQGHLSVSTHQSESECMAYCKVTGDLPLLPLSRMGAKPKG